MLNVKVIDDEEYEKNKTFIIVLAEPILLDVGQRHGELILFHVSCRLYIILILGLEQFVLTDTNCS